MAMLIQLSSSTLETSDNYLPIQCMQVQVHGLWLTLENLTIFFLLICKSKRMFNPRKSDYYLPIFKSK